METIGIEVDRNGRMSRSVVNAQREYETSRQNRRAWVVLMLSTFWLAGVVVHWLSGQGYLPMWLRPAGDAVCVLVALGTLHALAAEVWSRRQLVLCDR